MKIMHKPEYVCEICGSGFDDAAAARTCEAKPAMAHNFNPGAMVRILRGDGAGKLAKIDSVSLADYTWGHYAAKYYHHTPLIVAEIEGERGCCRQLCFDDCELIE